MTTCQSKAIGGVEGILPLDGFQPRSAVVSPKLAWGRTPTRGNSKVSDDDDSSSDESEHGLSPNEVQIILDEYQQVIKKYKSKYKVLEIEYAKLKASK